MKKIAGLLLFLVTLHCKSQQPEQRNKELFKVDTSQLDLQIFAKNITGTETDDYEKARKLLYWLSSNFEWKATDYKTRTVKEIIARNGGNCFELAKVYLSLVQAAGIRYRSMAEINIQPKSERRQATAALMVEKKGKAFSVFGLQHNDHRWVEIYDAKNGRWEPADPSMGVIGLTDWLKARVWFGERKTIDTAITNQMIVPFAIFITNDSRTSLESRTHYYLVDQFNSLYDNKISSLPEWKEWIVHVDALTETALGAFQGKQNLHTSATAISELADIYERLKKSYAQQYRTN